VTVTATMDSFLATKMSENRLMGECSAMRKHNQRRSLKKGVGVGGCPEESDERFKREGLIDQGMGVTDQVGGPVSWGRESHPNKHEKRPGLAEKQYCPESVLTKMFR